MEELKSKLQLKLAVEEIFESLNLQLNSYKYRNGYSTYRNGYYKYFNWYDTLQLVLPDA